MFVFRNLPRTNKRLAGLEPSQFTIKRGHEKRPYVEGLIEEKVSNLIETYNLLKIGARNRHVSSTSMNKESSRSHSVFTLYIESKSNFDGLTNFKSSRFNLIDLAGSERQKSTACLGERLKEAGMINKSLSALGNVINCLVEVGEGKQRHIPYRDSKLTFLLKDSLGGNSKTFIIANISPSILAVSETLSTLKFAQRAKLIRNSAVINEDTSGTVQMLKAENKRLKAELEAIQQLAQVAMTKCPKCAGLNQVDLPSLLNTFEKNCEAEELLEMNLRLRIDMEKRNEKVLQAKEKEAETLKSVVSKLENKINHDKMILKFRNATIAKLQNGEVDKDTEALRQENEILREQIENNPILFKLSAENKLLTEELSEMRIELESGYGSIQQQNTALRSFTETLNSSLKTSTLEREKLKTVFNLLNNGSDIEQILKAFEETYESKIEELSNDFKTLEKEHSQVLAENKMIHQNFMEHFEGEENLLDSKIEESPRVSLRSEEETRRLEKELEEFKLKYLSEVQSKDRLFIEKRNIEKALGEVTQENSELKEAKEKLTVVEGQVEVFKEMVEEKYRDFVQVSQEVDNLTESNEYLKGEMTQLREVINEKRVKIEELEGVVSGLERQIKEQSSLIESLHEPTGNKTLALALSEAETYKCKCQELETDLASFKKSLIEAQNSNTNQIKNMT